MGYSDCYKSPAKTPTANSEILRPTWKRPVNFRFQPLAVDRPGSDLIRWGSSDSQGPTVGAASVIDRGTASGSIQRPR